MHPGILAAGAALFFGQLLKKKQVADEVERQRLIKTNKFFRTALAHAITPERSASLTLGFYRKQGGSNAEVIVYWQKQMGLPRETQTGRFDTNTLSQISADEQLELMFG